MNWNCPGAISGTEPRTVQLESANDVLVAASSVRLAPGTFVRDI